MKVNQLATDAEKCVKLLQDAKQALWAVLRSSLAQQLDYWLQLCYPTDVKYAAERMDRILWQVLQVVAGSVIPRRECGAAWSCIVDVPMELAGERDRTFQEWAVRQPLKLGGLGLRSQLDTIPQAFVGALEQTRSSFGGEHGITPQLGHLVAEAGAAAQRWAPLRNLVVELGKSS